MTIVRLDVDTFHNECASLRSSICMPWRQLQSRQNCLAVLLFGKCTVISKPTTKALMNIPVVNEEDLRERCHTDEALDCVRPLTCALVRELLREEDDELYEQDPGDEDVAGTDRVHIADEGDLISTNPESTLSTTRNWLEELCNEEQSKADSEPEYHFQRVVRHPEGAELPSFSGAESIHRDGLTDILVKPPGLALKIEIVDRISRGEGPRDTRYNDLLAPLRLNSDSPDRAIPYCTETYRQLYDVLQKWNKHVGSILDLSAEREELLEALNERAQLISKIEKGLKKRAVLDHPNPRLQQALRAFRPEIAGFENQSVFDILVMLVANLRVANPDLDDETKCAIIRVVYREARLTLLSDKEYNAKKRDIQSKLESARRADDEAEVKRLNSQKHELQMQSHARRAETTIDFIRNARKDLYWKALLEMQDLALQQAGQKWAASERLSAQEQSEQKRKDMEGALENTAKPLAHGIALCEAAVVDMANMAGLIHECIIRMRKTAALDLTDSAARDRVRKERMENPETALVMMKVSDNSKAVLPLPSLIMEHMSQIEGHLGKLSAAASYQFRVYDGILQRLSEGPTLEELGYETKFVNSKVEGQEEGGVNKEGEKEVGDVGRAEEAKV